MSCTNEHRHCLLGLVAALRLGAQPDARPRCCRHPAAGRQRTVFKQYQGSQARFTTTEGAEFKVPAFTHHVSDYLRAALGGGLRLVQLDEWWHPDDDAGGAPRLLSLLFERG